jgi:hypothetical protein
MRCIFHTENAFSFEAAREAMFASAIINKVSKLMQTLIKMSALFKPFNGFNTHDTISG